MVQSVQTTETPTFTTPTTPSTTTRGSSATGAVKNDLRGKSFVQQEAALTPRDSKEPDKPAKPASLDEALSQWEPRLKKVTDPVSFMTSGGKGNYNAAIANAKSKAGFFEQAKAELGALATEMQGFSGTAGERAAELGDLIALAGAWSNLYKAIQGTGMSKEGAADPAARAKVHTRVRAVADEAAPAIRQVLKGALLSDTTKDAIGNAYDEISLFVDSWSDVSSTSGKTSASPYMWGAFLQTIERYRSILNQYGKLDERGGDASGTAKLAVKDSDKSKGMVKDGERYDEVAEAKGGGMAVALETYNYRVANIDACQKQTAAMLARVEAGEFETAEAAVAAFRKTIGAGMASEAFYKNVEQLALGAWHTQHGGDLIAEGDVAAKQAYKAYRLSEEASARSSTSMGKAEKAHDVHTTKAEERDAHSSEAAYEAVLFHKKRATYHADEAVALANAGDTRKTDAHAKYAAAETELANAEIALAKVDPAKYPHLAPGVTEVSGKLQATKGKLATSKEEAAALDKISADIQNRALSAKKIAGDYDPEHHEVETPPLLDGKLEHYKKFSLSVHIDPLWFLKLEAGIAGEWGTEREAGKDEITSFTEDEASGKITIDLWLLALYVGFKTSTRFEVDADRALDYQTVQDYGNEEKAKWEAAKEVDKSGAKGRLLGGFSTEGASMNQVYTDLSTAAEAYAAGGDQGSFNAALFAAELGINAAQGQLATDVMFNSGGSWMSGAIEAQKLPKAETMVAALRSLKSLSRKQVLAEVKKQDKAHDKLMAHATAQTTDRFNDLAGMKNDPSVRFESSGAWFTGAEVAAGDWGVGYEYSQTTSIGDGEGAIFDMKEHESSSHKVNVKTPWGELTGALTTKDDGEMEIGIEFEAEQDLGDKKEQEEFSEGLGAKLKRLKGALSGKGEGLISLVKDVCKKAIDEQFEKMVTPKKKLGAKEKVSIGLDLSKAPEGAWEAEFSISYGVAAGGELDLGVIGGEANVEQGMKVTRKLF